MKMRRIYELMNILEGCNSVRRIAKGEYEWLGFIDDLREVVPSRKKEETSLSNLAHKVKRMLREAEGEVSIREIERRV